MRRPSRTELEAENLVLYQELEAIRDRLDALLEESDTDPDDNDEFEDGGSRADSIED